MSLVTLVHNVDFVLILFSFVLSYSMSAKTYPVRRGFFSGMVLAFTKLFAALVLTDYATEKQLERIGKC